MVKLNKILNKIIKAILKALSTLLINIIIFYFYKSELLNCYKVIIIIILRKANKKDYLFLGSY